MTATTSAQQTSVDVQEAQPYAPSWVDRLTAAIARAPGPTWAYYGGAALLVLLAGTAIKWRDEVLPFGTIPPFYVVAFCTPFYYLALIHYLDIFAAQTFDEFRPALDVGDAEAAVLRYSMTTMPAREAMQVTIAGLLISGLNIWGMANGMVLAGVGVFSSPLSIALESLIVFFTNPIMFVFLYHAKHQLWTISLILTRCTTVNLFRQGPLYVFPRLTARTSVSLILIGYLWVITQPNANSDIGTVVISALVGTTGFAAFVWPLWGVHRVLVAQKTRAIDAVSQRLRAAMNEVHRRVDDARYDEVGAPVQAVNALRQELDMLEKIPTWPWRPETVSGVLTALVLPMVLWVTTRILERILAL